MTMLPPSRGTGPGSAKDLVKRIEANRKRTLWLGAATLVLAIVVLTAVPF